MNEELNELMLDLLCKKAIYGLTEQEERELARLQADAGVDDDSLSFELAAAAIGSGFVEHEDMPAHLKSQILAGAERYFDERSEAGSAPVATVVPESPTSSLFGWLGWAVAAAACLVLAFNLYYTRLDSGRIAQVPPTPTPEIKLTPEQMRERLIQSAPDLARGSWGAGNVKNVTPGGDIVWSDAKQDGYMRLTGLPVNDPDKETYQLWIFDETQSDKTPIDGGTFSVNSSGEVVIPIHAKLNPRNTKMYAITIEKPGGVVVSDRSKIVALAKRET